MDRKRGTTGGVGVKEVEGRKKEGGEKRGKGGGCRSGEGRMREG